MNTSSPNTNWNAVCTKPKTEKKVSATLAKLQIETFLPLKKTQKTWKFLSRVDAEPLMPTLVFVKASADQLSKIRRIEGVVSFLYWLNQPAVIQDRDIELIHSFLEQYDDVRIGRMPVGRANLVSVGRDAEATEMVQNNGMETVSLASLGYVLMANVPSMETVSIKAQAENSNVTQLYSYRDAC